ncbi:hypothetical protein [Streptomyces sp. NPDC057686]|uniref:hypothetical protein n=1 Tax=Streptomyces TaxID=1883 RepID=UPI003685D639
MNRSLSRVPFGLRALMVLWPLMGITTVVLLAVGLPAPAAGVVALGAGLAVGWPWAARTERARRAG